MHINKRFTILAVISPYKYANIPLHSHYFTLIVGPTLFYTKVRLNLLLLHHLICYGLVCLTWNTHATLS